MTTISNVKVYDLEESVIAARNAMRLTPPEYTEEEFNKSLERAVKLTDSGIKTGISCHSNYLVGIRVSFDITYPQYLTPEMQRYHFFDIVSSSSKMHRLCKMDLSKCCNKYVDPEIIRIEQKNIDAYNITMKNEPNNPDLWELWRDEAYRLFMEMVSNCPLGLELFMRVSTNYKQLQTIYFQRKNHKLKEDWGAICEMIENLPHSELIIGSYGTDSKGQVGASCDRIRPQKTPNL